MRSALRRFFLRTLDKLARRQGFTLVRIRDADSVLTTALTFRSWLDTSGWMNDGTQPRHAKKLVARHSHSELFAANKLTSPARFI